MIRPLAILAALLISAPLCASAADADTVRHGLATKVDTMYAKWLLSSSERNWTSQFKGPIDT
ncbi:MAG: hypothetical protein ACO27L_01900, partial [Schleiferiaceae bacterium]